MGAPKKSMQVALIFDAKKMPRINLKSAMPRSIIDAWIEIGEHARQII